MEQQSFIERYGESYASTSPRRRTLTSTFFDFLSAGFGEFPSCSVSTPHTNALTLTGDFVGMYVNVDGSLTPLGQTYSDTV
jgi:hypothetical protein